MEPTVLAQADEEHVRIMEVSPSGVEKIPRANSRRPKFDVHDFCFYPSLWLLGLSCPWCQVLLSSLIASASEETRLHLNCIELDGHRTLRIVDF